MNLLNNSSDFIKRIVRVKKNKAIELWKYLKQQGCSFK